MTQMQTRTGGCHCGAVRYEAESDLDLVVECNCSHCAAKGFILTFVPEDAFRVTAGEDQLIEYKFHKHQIRHLFCATCGVQAFARGRRPDGPIVAALNLRCMDGVDVASLDPKPVDGSKF